MRGGLRYETKAWARTAFMKAFVFERTGDPNDVLAVRELPEPKPGPGEILVRVRLSPVHPSDMHIMRGRFGRQPTLPASPGAMRAGPQNIPEIAARLPLCSALVSSAGDHRWRHDSAQWVWSSLPRSCATP